MPQRRLFRVHMPTIFAAITLCAVAMVSGAALADTVVEPRPSVSDPLLPLPDAAAPTRKMTVDDLVTLLEAGVGEAVILRQLQSTGTRLVMTVDALLQLKSAGASDTFLEALLKPEEPEKEGPGDPGPVSRDTEDTPPTVPFPADATEAASHAIRIYEAENENGDPVIHITNLDEDGRRIGGEIPPEARRNVIAPRDIAPPAPIDLRDDYGHDAYDDHEGSTPVVVNVYPPEPSAPAVPPYSHIGGAFYPVVSYPSPSYGYGYHSGYRPGYRGYRYGHVRYLYSPPGSYSHYITYHRPAGTHYFNRFEVKRYGRNPYRVYRQPARVRNNAYFGKR